jgi:nucleoside-diphosphate-sugar epimerase
VGSSVVRALSADAGLESVLGVARRRPELSVPKVEWAVADVTRDELAPLFAGADAVVHLAWAIQPSRDLTALWRTNVAGSQRVFDAAREAGVPALVYASSVGAYSPGPKDRAVDESWPTGGIPSSFYARHKAEVERRLDRFEREHAGVRVVRLRPGLTFKRTSASGQRRLFAGPLVPGFLARPGLIPFFPDVPRLRFQAVHTDDVAEAYRLAVTGDARGAFNVAAEPVLDSAELARILGARLVRVPERAMRRVVDVTWRLHLQPTPAGWADLALCSPLLDTTRARTELGWAPRRSAEEAIRELLAGVREGAGEPTPPLHPDAGGPARIEELATGIGESERA